MKLIEKTYSRILFLMFALCSKLQLWAQDNSDDEEESFASGTNSTLYDIEDYSFLNISYYDIALMILLLLTCILLARIRKELVYIFLCLAALAYYFTIH